MESTLYGHPGEPMPGPPLPAALRDVQPGNFGITFEENGLRARVDKSIVRRTFTGFGHRFNQPTHHATGQTEKRRKGSHRDAAYSKCRSTTGRYNESYHLEFSD